jgi:xanthine dehydrogenase YagR molybdenum-binding subunit
MVDEQPLPRLDAESKVRGTARYAGDLPAADALHAVIVGSPIACGRVVNVHADPVLALPGVVAVVTHRDAMKLASTGYRLPLQNDSVRFAGEPIAVVVAQELSSARRGAAALHVHCEPGPAVLSLADASAHAYSAPEAAGGVAVDSRRGNPEAAMAAAPVVLTRSYRTPSQNHHPIEPHVAIASWDGDCLTVHTASQAVFNSRRMLARAFDVAERNVRIISPLLGGGFGSKGRAWFAEMTLTAMLARQLGRPVRLELTRSQMFTLVGRRPEALQNLTLAADREGRLKAIVHHSLNETSTYEAYADPNAAISRWLYACPNVVTTHRCAPRNAPHSNPMRAPGEGTGSFALETALDELAYELKIDPLELRRINYAERDPHLDRPWSSNRLLECYRVAAQSFGWKDRPAETGRLTDGPWRIGWGMATAAYPVYRAAAQAAVRLKCDGRIEVRCGTQDLGTGTLTVLAQLGAAILGVTAQQTDVALGDTLLPQGPASGGAIATASFTPAVEAAALALRDKLLDMVVADPASPLHGLDAKALEMADGAVRQIGGGRSESLASVASRSGSSGVEAIASASPDAGTAVSAFSHGAVFVEVAVDSELGEIRVRRLTAAYAAGRILNPLLARSQYLGGLVCGIGMALCEEAGMDLRLGRIPGDNLCDYLLPVHADMPRFDLHLVEEADPFLASGVKGIGMIGAVGTAAAIANAAFHATGARVRELPLRLEHMMARPRTRAAAGETGPEDDFKGEVRCPM